MKRYTSSFLRPRLKYHYYYLQDMKKSTSFTATIHFQLLFLEGGGGRGESCDIASSKRNPMMVRSVLYILLRLQKQTATSNTHMI